jgi:hypothetical protein
MKTESNLRVTHAVDKDPGYTQAICPSSMVLLAESASEFNQQRCSGH